MTLRELVKDLINKGHDIAYHERRDGGIEVLSIDGVKYSKRKGNAEVRRLAGAKLSKAKRRQLKELKLLSKGQITQLTKMIRPKSTHRWGRPKLNPIPTDAEKAFQALKRAWKKYQPLGRGKVTKKGLRARYAQGESWEEITISLKKQTQYARGIAYEENVRLEASRIRALAEQIGSEELERAADLLESKAGRIKESLLSEIIQAHYSLQEMRLLLLSEENDEDIEGLEGDLAYLIQLIEGA